MNLQTMLWPLGLSVPVACAAAPTAGGVTLPGAPAGGAGVTGSVSYPRGTALRLGAGRP